MKKNLLKKIIFCFGFLAIGLLIVTYSWSLSPAAPKIGLAKKVEYTSGNLRDPFESPFEMGDEVATESVVGLPQLQVQGMIWGSAMPQAIVNNTIVKIGEIVDGAEILDIRKEGVYVLYEGKQYILRPIISK